MPLSRSARARILVALAVAACAVLGWLALGARDRPAFEVAAATNDREPVAHPGAPFATPDLVARAPLAAAAPTRGLAVLAVDAISSSPIAGARVWVADARHRFVPASAVVGTTDAGGELRLEPVDSVAWVGVHAQGFVPRAEPVRPDVERVVLRLARGHRLSIRVVDLLDRPVGGIPLIASRRLVLATADPWQSDEALLPFGDGDAAIHVADAADDGVATFSDLPPGAYDVRPGSTSGFLAVVDPEIHGPYDAGGTEHAMRVTQVHGCAIRIEGAPAVQCEVIRGMASVDFDDEDRAVERLRAILTGELPRDALLFLWPATAAQLRGVAEPGASVTWLGRTSGWQSQAVHAHAWDRIPQHIAAIRCDEVEPSRCGELAVTLVDPAGIALDGIAVSAQRAGTRVPIHMLPMDLSSGARVVEAGEYDVYLPQMPGSRRRPLARVRVAPGESVSRTLCLDRATSTVVLSFVDANGIEYPRADVRLLDASGRLVEHRPFLRSGFRLVLPVGDRIGLRVRVWPYPPVERVVEGLAAPRERHERVTVDG